MKKGNFKFLFGSIGAWLGLPLSYYFQPGMVRQKMSITTYMKEFIDILKYKDLYPNVIISVIVFAAIGFAIGYFIDNNDSLSGYSHTKTKRRQNQLKTGPLLVLLMVILLVIAFVTKSYKLW
jgi:hypothetical protein